MDLQQLGITKTEQKVYEALVSHGKISAAQASKESGVSYGKIYVILSSLEAKGLVRIIPEKTKKYAATDPKNLLDLISTQENNLVKLKKEVNQFKDNFAQYDKEAVEVVYGIRSFYKVIATIKRAVTFDYMVRYNVHYDPRMIRKFKENIKRGINIKTLVRFSEETKSNLKKWSKIKQNARILENDGISMAISDHQVWITLMNKHTTIVVRDAAFVKMMKKLFENTYKVSKEV